MFQICNCSTNRRKNCCSTMKKMCKDLTENCKNIGQRLRNRNSRIQSETSMENVEECSICLEQYEKKKRIISRRKIILPCCKQGLCENCKKEWIEKEPQNRLEVLLKVKNEMQQIKCMKCPFCCRTIPQKESHDALLWEIQNNSMKIHEQIQLLKEVNDGNTILAIVQEAMRDDNYWQILWAKIREEEHELGSKIELALLFCF